MLPAALFLIAKNLKQLKWYTHTMGYDTTMKKNKLSLLIRVWKIFKDILLNNRSQAPIKAHIEWFYLHQVQKQEKLSSGVRSEDSSEEYGLSD